MSTYLNNVMPKFLGDLLPKAKVVAEADEEAVQRLANIEMLLEKVKEMDFLDAVKIDHLIKAKALDQTDHGAIDDNMLMNKPKLLLQTLLYQVSCLERGLNDNNLEAQTKKTCSNSTDPEAIKQQALLSQLPPIEKKIYHLMTLLQQLPTRRVEKQSGVDAAREMSQEPSTLGLEDVFDVTDAMANIKRSYEDLEST